MKKSQLRQLIREEIKKSYLNESLEALISKATKIQSFVDKQGKEDGYEGGAHSPVGGVLAALKVAGGPGFDGDKELEAFYTRKLSKAIETQMGKKYMSGLDESVNEAKEKFSVIVKQTGEVIDDGLPKDLALKLAAKKKGWVIQIDESVNEAEFKHISPKENEIKLAIKDVEKKAKLKANRNKTPEYKQEALNKIMLSKVLGREELGEEHQGAWEKLKKKYDLR